MKKQLGIFDFDGTLTSQDTFIRFGIFAVGRAKFLRALVIASPWLLSWKLKCITSSQAKERLFGCLFKGMPIDEFNRLGEAFADEIDQMLRPEVIGRLKFMHKSGAQIVIASASPENWIAPWAKHHGISTIVATRLEVSDGKLTGSFATPNCLGAEKVARIRKELGEMSDYEVFAYGNMPEDAEMLAMADHAIIIG